MLTELKLQEDLRLLNVTLKFDKSALIDAFAVLERNPQFLHIVIYSEATFEDFDDADESAENCMSDPVLEVWRSGACLTWIDRADDTQFQCDLPIISVLNSSEMNQ
ncbi:MULTISPECIES: hypothetical protein [Morganellaceae]|uniref:Uncharacterized protein n=4 Tax=Morganellaceae TaxID=1903414 RepID=A0A1B8HD03_9GAMM|nr:MULTISPECIES: hypothetical protein [Morganellaceae]QCJ72283.1 hypothetical protein C9446_21030 [Providencia heimbachae]OBU06943.1 hypothetical protein AYY17_19585 [Morganella psychrotolerans]UNH29118.1 hypothetical protein MNY64_16340 [Moellerella wisconsensis]UNH32612.1 hypothetical protein MNY72_16445 [Moellerella wisconsensis]UNH40699.1 hypothetical protein MNY70_17835 [Moellerella wisconsensis]